MRKGFFKISDELYTQDWDIISQIFKDFRPIRISKWNAEIWYVMGVSDKFDEVDEGEPTPEYVVVFTRQPDGELTYVFKRV